MNRVITLIGIIIAVVGLVLMLAHVGDYSALMAFVAVILIGIGVMTGM